VLDVWYGDYTGAPNDGSTRTGSSDKRVARGGSFADGVDQIRSASRMALAMHTGDGKTGFRVVREVD
jgi:formylglycine-generating enzyme required for sulfatase activity